MFNTESPGLTVTNVVARFKRNRPMRGAPFSVIVACTAEIGRLGDCLATLCSQDLEDVHIVAVCNLSELASRRLMQRYKNVEFLDGFSTDAASMFNIALRRNASDVVALLDAEFQPDLTWVARMKANARRSSVVGGRIDTYSRHPDIPSGASIFDSVFAYNQRKFISRQGFAVLSNLIIPREILERVGLFVRGSAAHLDWCERVLAMGYRLDYCDELCVQAPQTDDWAAMRKKWQCITFDAFDRMHDRPFGRVVWVAKALAMPVSILAHSPRIFLAKHLDLKAKFRGFVMLARLRLSRMMWMLNLYRQAGPGA